MSSSRSDLSSIKCFHLIWSEFYDFWLPLKIKLSTCLAVFFLPVEHRYWNTGCKSAQVPPTSPSPPPDFIWEFFVKLVLPKNQLKKDYFGVLPQGDNQLLNVNQLWGVDKNRVFQTFFVDFRREITEKGLSVSSFPDLTYLVPGTKQAVDQPIQWGKGTFKQK